MGGPSSSSSNFKASPRPKTAAAATMQSAAIFRPIRPLFTLQPTNTTVVSASLNHPRNQNPKREGSPLKSSLPRKITAVSSGHAAAGGDSALRGSDILLALQKAATLKKKKQKKRKTSGGGEEDRAFPQQDLDINNVRPINVRGDWIERINELERRVQELKTRYHY